MGSIDRTKELFSTLIQRPTLTDQLLQRPPFKFIHDIVHETLRVSGDDYLDGLFTHDELDAAWAGSSRDTKMAFLHKLIDALNMDGHLDDVKPAKIVAGKEAEMTNLLLQSLASDATQHINGRKKAEASAATTTTTTVVKKKDAASSKPKQPQHGGGVAATASSSSKSAAAKDVAVVEQKISTTTTTTKRVSKKDKEKKEERSSSKNRSKDNNSKVISGRNSSKTRDSTKLGTNEAAAEKYSTDREKRKKQRSDAAAKNKSSTINADDADGSNVVRNQQQPSDADVIYNADLRHDETTRTTPARESSGGTSKGGDDSGIAEEMSAESERDKYGASGAVTNSATTSDFIEVHPSSPSSPSPAGLTTTRHGIRPPTTAAGAGRPQTAIGRPGTAVARMAPPKPKKIVISTGAAAAAAANVAEEEKLQQQAIADQHQQQQQFAGLILEENAENGRPKDAAENFLIAEDDDDAADQLLLLGAAAEGANVTNLRQGDEHGILVNRIVENTRMLEEKHLQEDGPFVEADEPDLQEQRRVRVEIESVQRVLQHATQNVQPLVRTMEFVADDFDTMLRELDECRKQSLVLERKLEERASGVRAAEAVVLNTALRALDADIRDMREQLARSAANVLENERKIAALLEANHHNQNAKN